MSDCWSRDISYLDTKTELIITGYFRPNFPENILPSDIIYLTLSSVDDHFMMTRGSYQWFMVYR